jgi:general secretion pathway protein K
LLIATLSFVVLSISERTILASSLFLNARARAELYWRSFGVEALALAALAKAAEGGQPEATLSALLLAPPQEIPMDGGGAELAFEDAANCFNLNALVRQESGAYVKNAPAIAEFETVIGALTTDGAAARSAVAAVVDWIDADSFQEADGAEDGVYLSLPEPYRSGGTLLADASELRAMRGVDAKSYAAVRPFVCAHPETAPSTLNVNRLDERQGPLLVGLTAGAITAAQARALIRDRPPGGYRAIEDFWAEEVFQGKSIPEAARSRASLASRFVEARAAVRYGEQTAEARMLFEVGENGRPRLISRRIGAAPQ